MRPVVPSGKPMSPLMTRPLLVESRYDLFAVSYVVGIGVGLLSPTRPRLSTRMSSTRSRPEKSLWPRSMP